MRSKEFLNEVIVDPIHGIGAVPNNQEIDYYGIRVKMKPSIFLKLASPFDSLSGNNQRIEKIAQYIKNGGSIAPPFLNIRFQEMNNQYDFNEPALVSGHEGRHRMMAVQMIDGDIPIEVHLFFYQINRRGLTKDIVEKVNSLLYSQNDFITEPLEGPFFTLISKL
jgi:hypothetical protein